MKLWNKKSTKRSRKITGTISFIFLVLLILFVNKEYSYKNFCHDGKFEFNSSRYQYSFKEIISSTLCPFPTTEYIIQEEPSRFNEFDLTVIEETKKSRDIVNEPNIIIDEIELRKQMIEFLLYYIKFNFFLALFFLTVYPISQEFEERIRTKIIDVILWIYLMFNFAFGLLTYIFFMI